MKNIKFIPKEFNDIKLGINENDIYPITPNYPDPILVMLNEVAIEAPKKIIFTNHNTGFVPIIPICGYYSVTSRRSLKYAAQNTMVLHMKHSSDNNWQVGEIKEQYSNEYPEEPAWEADLEKERLNEIKKAQDFDDSELNMGSGSANAFNINAMSYINFPLEAGKYDIYITMSGLESNHVQVEIVFEE